MESEDVIVSKWSPISLHRSCRYRWTAGYLNCPLILLREKLGKSVDSTLLTFVCLQTWCPVLERRHTCDRFDTWNTRTLRSASNEFIELLTTSSVNSGNSFKLLKKLAISCANAFSCAGNSSTSISFGNEGRAMWGNFLWGLRRRFLVVVDTSVLCLWSA